MINYIITAKFRSSNDIDFREYVKELNNAVNSFNKESIRIGKNSILSLRSINRDDFDLILESPTELSHPSKALVKFSQALIAEQSIKPYVVNENQLLRCTDTQIYNSPEADLTDGQFLTAAILLVHNTDCCTDSVELTKRKNLLGDLKKLIKTYRLV